MRTHPQPPPYTPPHTLSLLSDMDDAAAYWASPTTKAFVALLDNYEREVGKPEDYTAEERKEMSHFLQVPAEAKPRALAP